MKLLRLDLTHMLESWCGVCVGARSVCVCVCSLDIVRFYCIGCTLLWVATA